MPILGFNLNSISAKVNEEKLGEDKININSSPKIENVEKADLALGSLKEVLSVDFSFNVSYEPSVGEINMKGAILYQTDDIKGIVAKWKKDKSLDGKIGIELMNVIFRKCLTKALDLSLDLRLPPPLQFPVVKPKEE